MYNQPLQFYVEGVARCMPAQEGAPTEDGEIRLPMAGTVAIVLAAALLAAPVQAADYSWPVVRVVDGDTVKVDAGGGPAAGTCFPLRSAARRRYPRKGRRAKCNAEKQAAAAATAFAEEAIQKAGSIVVRDPAWGKWGGRVVADLILDDFSLSSALLEAGHARRYDGGKRGGWCELQSRGD